MLAPGWQVASFPLDLAEALFAAQALKRHLLARAWATDAMPEDGFEALAQAVKRAAPGRWLCALRFFGQRLEARPIAKELSVAVRPIPRSSIPEGLVRAALSEGLLVAG